jgi:BirA family biotin operon repressor/biotin-[acetyl-CoA-carboxylase] ligase
MGRQWQSADLAGASLTFSLGLPLAPADWSGLSLAVGLSLAQSLHSDVRLKWPNDLWWQDRKLGGVLIETCSVGAARYAVIGVGINIAARDAAGLSVPPAALVELLPGVDAPKALHTLAPPLVGAVLRFAQEGFAPLRQAFLARDALLGREVVCSDGVMGSARSVDPSGALLVHTAQGVQKISSAEVSVRLEGTHSARPT